MWVIVENADCMWLIAVCILFIVIAVGFMF